VGRYRRKYYVAARPRRRTSAQHAVSENPPTSRLLMERKYFHCGDQSDAAAPLYIPRNNLSMRLYLAVRERIVWRTRVDNLQSIYVAGSTDSPTSCQRQQRRDGCARFNRLLPSPAHTDFLANSPLEPAHSAVYELAYSTYSRAPMRRQCSGPSHRSGDRQHCGRTAPDGCLCDRHDDFDQSSRRLLSRESQRLSSNSRTRPPGNRSSSPP